MSELRWDPVSREWVITATHRQNRTFKPPKDYCPLCPTKEGGFPTEVPEDYDLVVFQNKFPSLQANPPEPDIGGSVLYPVDKAEGICEVVLFTPEHNGIMSREPLSRYVKLVKVWQDRYQELGSKDFIDYVFIFENKGEEVGVTLEHPHGQIYAYPFIPPKIKRELDSSRDHYEKEGECLFCSLIAEEIADGRRVVTSNDSFTAIVPFFARYTYEVHIYANNHLSSFNDFCAREIEDLAEILRTVIQKYDNLFGFVFPYIMAIHQQPTDGSGEEYSHFHIEFYPPYRTKDKLKYLAGSEAGAGAYINNSLPEDKAAELRKIEVVKE
ncbi:galactose-1-phosphate uridylyltransferase [Iocasia frigidifontis]|uniref:Galactose-1-phosphate uridylyltransferase n=1 Tax=Iocasia fonsfrigidae TaxID=2682810 RepID=A0A8A7K6K2_9FIRM|nr:galactose-1-phosphate uridylyltransferase [Iocasia fonsfrigidae]QTL97346.1 galactose-1-phosphate uridylyltransferase [Iocasia fonsfrigidae]